MERRNSKEWIKSLKIAIINNDLEQIKRYSQREVPNFSSIEEAKKALNLINQAKEILIKEKNKIRKILKVLKKTQLYNDNFNQNNSFEFKA